MYLTIHVSIDLGSHPSSASLYIWFPRPRTHYPHSRRTNYREYGSLLVWALLGGVPSSHCSRRYERTCTWCSRHILSWHNSVEQRNNRGIKTCWKCHDQLSNLLNVFFFGGVRAMCQQPLETRNNTMEGRFLMAFENWFFEESNYEKRVCSVRHVLRHTPGIGIILVYLSIPYPRLRYF